MNGSSSSSGSGAGLILSHPEGEVVEHVLWFDFSITNNEVEYKTLFVELNYKGAKSQAPYRLQLSASSEAGKGPVRSPGEHEEVSC